MIGFKPSTDGEYLYEILVKRFVNNSSDLRGAIHNLRNLEIGNRRDDFADYYAGIFCFNLTARITKAAKYLIEQPDLGDALHFGSMLELLYNQFMISEFNFKKSDVHLLVNMSFEAARNARQNISDTTKTSVLAGKSEINCYICGEEIFETNGDPKYVIQFEHIWPRGYGGDSSSANLLPACHECNNRKSNMMLWQDAHIHSVILKPNQPSEDIKISRIAKIAKHRQAIFKYACSNAATLKEAALVIGPYDFSNIQLSDPNDSSDFFTFHF